MIEVLVVLKRHDSLPDRISGEEGRKIEMGIFPRRDITASIESALQFALINRLQRLVQRPNEASLIFAQATES